MDPRMLGVVGQGKPSEGIASALNLNQLQAKHASALDQSTAGLIAEIDSLSKEISSLQQRLTPFCLPANTSVAVDGAEQFSGPVAVNSSAPHIRSLESSAARIRVMQLLVANIQKTLCS